MWLSEEEEKRLEEIRDNNQLTEQEQAAVKNYDNFMGLRIHDPSNTGIGSPAYRELQDILEKYGKKQTKDDT